MTLTQLPLLLLFLFPLAYSPGPGNLFFAALGARFGLWATLPASLGYHIATLAVSFAIGLGASVALDENGTLFLFVQKAGALYILWLAWKLVRSHSTASLQTARPAGMLNGAVLLLLNPKGYLIMALLFTQFPAANTASALLIATVFTLNNLLAFLIWSLAGQTLARQLASPRAAVRLNISFAACLAGVGLWLLLSGLG